MLGKTPKETMLGLKPYLKQISNNWCHILSSEKAAQEKQFSYAYVSDSTEFKPDNRRRSILPCPVPFEMSNVFVSGPG